MVNPENYEGKSVSADQNNVKLNINTGRFPLFWGGGGGHNIRKRENLVRRELRKARGSFLKRESKDGQIYFFAQWLGVTPYINRTPYSEKFSRTKIFAI